MTLGVSAPLAVLQAAFGLLCTLQTYSDTDVYSEYTWQVLAALNYTATIVMLLATLVTTTLATPTTRLHVYLSLVNAAWLVLVLLSVGPTFLLKFRHVVNVQGYVNLVGALVFFACS